MNGGRDRRKGFSLVEMVIIIGMIGILVGGTGLAIGLLRSADTKGAAYDINSALTNLKSRTTGGKDQPYLYLYLLNNEYHMDTSIEKPDTYTPTADSKEIGDTRLQITYGSDKKALEDAPDGFLCIAFRKKDGAFLVEGKCVCPEEIYVGTDNVADYVVHMVQDTGHHYIAEQ